MKHALLIAITGLLLSGCAAVDHRAAVDDRATAASCFHVNEAAETEIGYCEAVRVGDTLYVSGTAARGEMLAAIRSAYDRLQKTLEANGMSFADVVKENVYATDLDAFIANKQVRREYYGDKLPAATWVEVKRLYVPSLVLEVELTAIKRK
jgi:enamine deaminase RidA (YjgF/YER057c/UK114 family)